MGKRIILLLVLCLLPLKSHAFGVLLGTGGTVSGVSCDVDISDDFTTDPLTSRWTEITGSDWVYDSVNDNLDSPGTSNSYILYVSNGTGTTTQWAKVEIVTLGTNGGVILSAAVDGQGYSWRIMQEAASITWAEMSNMVWNDPIGSSSAVSFTDGDTMAVSVYRTATLADTIIRIWKNPTGDCPSEWGAADITFTDNPANAPAGSYVGLGDHGVAVSTYDNFTAGDW